MQKIIYFLAQIVENWQKIWSRLEFQWFIGHDDICTICTICFVNKKNTNGYGDL